MELTEDWSSMMTLSSLRTSSSASAIVLRRLGGVSRALRACFGAFFVEVVGDDFPIVVELVGH